MKKTNKSAVLLLVLLVLVAVTAMYVASTYAKYVGEVDGEGTATVAKWSFKDDNEDVDFEVDLTKTYDASTLVAKKIAPGTEGSFNIVLNNENTETGVEYTVTLKNIANAPTYLKFYSDSAHTEELTVGGDGVTGHMDPNDATGVSVPIYWEWPYESNDDATDTSEGEAAKTMTVTVNVAGVQSEPQ